MPKRGFPPTVPLVEIVNAIIYKLKTGVQWHQLPIKEIVNQSVPIKFAPSKYFQGPKRS